MGHGFKDNEELKRLRDDLAAQSQEHVQAQSQADKIPLDWAQEYSATSGSVVATVSTAKGNRGDKIYSFTLARNGKEPGRTSKFFQPRDIADLDKALIQVVQWIEASKVA